MSRLSRKVTAALLFLAGLTWAIGQADQPDVGGLGNSPSLLVDAQAHVENASTSNMPVAARIPVVRAADKVAQPQGPGPATSVIGLTPTPAGRWGVIEHGNGVRTEVDHDGTGRISAIHHLYGEAVVAVISYSFDANGNRLTETIEAQGQSWTTSYQYDRSDRLVGYTSHEGTVSYTLDAVGNRIESNSNGIVTTHHFDSRDRLTEVRNAAGVILASFGYDEAGRQTSRTDHQTGTSTYYSYNAHDRLIAIRQGSPSAEPLVRYEYNASGQRTARIDATSREHYQWDGMKLTVRTNTLGNPLGHYTSASGWTLASTEGTESYSHHTDGLGTPMVLTDPQAGVAVRYRFDPWGVPVEQTKPHLNPIGFTGYLRDTSTDQLYAQARQYEPGVGRFTSVDPWTGDPRSPVSLNQYLYGYGNPGVYVDPDGRCGILSSLPNLSGVCGFVESRLLGIDLGTVEGQLQLADYRRGTREGALRTLVETAVGAAQLFADLSVAGRERLTGENFGASDRVGAVVSGMADTASDLPGAVATYAADREEAIRAARASGDFREVGDYVGRTQLEVGSAVGGTVGTTRAAVGMAARWTPSPSRPMIVHEGHDGTLANIPRGSDVPYSPSAIRAELESRYGAGNVVSTTVPPAYGKNVRLAGRTHPVTGVTFDSRGFPIFDDVAAYDTRLPTEPFRRAGFTGQMRLATQDLRRAIENGEIPASRFTPEQLRLIRSGAERIDGYSWHHHQDLGRMQLVRRELHAKTGHVGGEAMHQGR